MGSRAKGRGGTCSFLRQSARSSRAVSFWSSRSLMRGSSPQSRPRGLPCSYQDFLGRTAVLCQNNENLRGISTVVVRLLPKQETPVRFWYPAPSHVPAYPDSGLGTDIISSGCLLRRSDFLFSSSREDVAGAGNVPCARVGSTGGAAVLRRACIRRSVFSLDGERSYQDAAYASRRR